MAAGAAAHNRVPTRARARTHTHILTHTYAGLSRPLCVLAPPSGWVGGWGGGLGTMGGWVRRVSRVRWVCVCVRVGGVVWGRRGWVSGLGWVDEVGRVGVWVCGVVG